MMELSWRAVLLLLQRARLSSAYLSQRRCMIPFVGSIWFRYIAPRIPTGLLENLMSHHNVARQKKLAEVACYRPERTLVGCWGSVGENQPISVLSS